MLFWKIDLDPNTGVRPAKLVMEFEHTGLTNRSSGSCNERNLCPIPCNSVKKVTQSHPESQRLVITHTVFQESRWLQFPRGCIGARTQLSTLTCATIQFCQQGYPTQPTEMERNVRVINWNFSTLPKSQDPVKWFGSSELLRFTDCTMEVGEIVLAPGTVSFSSISRHSLPKWLDQTTHVLKLRENVNPVKLTVPWIGEQNCWFVPISITISSVKTVKRFLTLPKNR
eukprot:sb/3469571/